MQIIQHQELGSSQTSITFSSIPQTYTDLLVVFSLRDTSSASGYSESFLRFNGTTTNYSSKQLFGDGSSASSFSQADALRLWNTGNGNPTSNTFASIRVYVPNYTSSNNKSVSSESVTEGNNTGQGQFMAASLWSNTSAITSLSIHANGANSFVQYSSATLYGITKGSNGVVVS